VLKIDQTEKSNSNQHSRRRHATRRQISRSSSKIVLQTTNKQRRARKTKNYNDTIDIFHIAIQRSKRKE
jgi:hypothetical protein